MLIGGRYLLDIWSLQLVSELMCKKYVCRRAADTGTAVDIGAPLVLLFAGYAACGETLFLKAAGS